MKGFFRTCAPVLVLTMMACGSKSGDGDGKPTAVQTQPTAVKPAAPVPGPPFDERLTADARYLAGLPQESANDFTAMEKKSEWMEYSKLLSESWSSIETKRLAPMREWASTELASANATTQDVFYPFSGPDFVNVYTFFPNGKNYIMMGLEPPGTAPDLEKLPDPKLRTYMGSVTNALGDMMARSYFVTKDMLKDLRSEIDGATPIMLLFLARTSHRIVRIEKIAVDPEGRVVLYDPAANGKNKVLHRSRGVRIDFYHEGSSDIRSLYYFSVDVSDEKLKDNPGFVKYLDEIGTVTTYVKSASYLMHYLTFKIIRNAALNHSTHILQDDSGIAYRFFDKKVWDIRLYGAYTQPIKDFKSQHERDLAAAYDKDKNVQPLPFSLGYNWGTRGVNLLLATRKPGAP